MNNLAATYLHTDANSHIFALRIEKLATLTALGVRDDQYYPKLFARQVDWLTCLINSRNEQLTYDLRFICAPSADFYARGKITIALLCRMQDCTAQQAQDYAQELLRLCEAFFDDEYEFALIMQGSDLESLCLPFAINSLVEISHRAERASLDTLQIGARNKQLGFTPQPAALAVESEKSVYHVYPYLANLDSSLLLYKLLLMQKAPLAISFRIQPTQLKEDEAAFLETQIGRCERYAQFSIKNSGDDVEASNPTLQEQARAFQKRFTKSFYTLKDNAALLRVEIASPTAISQTLVDALGAHITQPAGGRQPGEDLSAYLSGGYEFAACSAEDLPERKNDFTNITLSIKPHKIAPPEAQRIRYLFDAMEATGVFRFPQPLLEDAPGFTLKTSRTRMAPTTLPVSGHLIGRNHHNGRVQDVRLSRDDRRRHLYAWLC